MVDSAGEGELQLRLGSVALTAGDGCPPRGALDADLSPVGVGLAAVYLGSEALLYAQAILGLRGVCGDGGGMGR